MYLSNPICNFTPLKKIDYDVKKNIYSLSLFKMGSGGYKRFEKYISGIEKLNKIAEKNGYEVRLFIDDTIYNDSFLMEKFNKMPSLSMIRYECKDFLIDKHHVGLFGTLVRFFPLFDFPNNDSNVVFVVDADVVERFFDTQTKILDLLNSYNLLDKIYLAYGGNSYHINNDSSEKFVKNGETIILPYCIADRIIGIQKIDQSPLVKFLTKLMNYMNPETRPAEILSNYYIEPDKYKLKCENNICFGIDEYFINNILFKHMIYSNIPFCYENTFNLSALNYYRHPDSRDFIQPKSVGRKYYNRVYFDLLKKVGLGKYSFKELDKMIYVENYNDLNPDKLIFIKKYKNIIHEIMNKIKPNIFTFVDYDYYNMTDYDKYIKTNYIKLINLKHDIIYYDSVVYDK